MNMKNRDFIMYSVESSTKISGSGDDDVIQDNGRLICSIKRKSSLKSMDNSSSSQRTNNTNTTNNNNNNNNVVGRSSDNNSCLDKSNGEKSVRFSSVDIRDYSLCLGDNPSVSRGVPISLDWDYDIEQSYELESYECNRCEDRRGPDQLKRPSLQRVHLLKSLGYSRGEISKQTKKTHLVKQQRFSTLRRADRKDRVKAFSRGIVTFFGNMLPASKSSSASSASSSSPQAKSKRCSCDTKTKQCESRTRLLEPDDDTLASSTSSSNRDL